MKRAVVTAAALAGLALAAFGAVQATAPGSALVCIAPAVIQAWS